MHIDTKRYLQHFLVLCLKTIAILFLSILHIIYLLQVVQNESVLLVSLKMQKSYHAFALY